MGVLGWEGGSLLECHRVRMCVCAWWETRKVQITLWPFEYISKGISNPVEVKPSFYHMAQDTSILWIWTHWPLGSILIYLPQQWVSRWKVVQGLLLLLWSLLSSPFSSYPAWEELGIPTSSVCIGASSLQTCAWSTIRAFLFSAPCLYGNMREEVQ